MDQMHVRKLLLGEYSVLLQLLAQRGVDFDPPYSDEEMATVSISDLKGLVEHLRDLSRTPPGNR